MDYRALARQLAVLAIAAATLGALPATSAQAHESLASSWPAAGSVLSLPPRIITLRMGAAASTAAVRLTDGCGRVVPAKVIVAGPRVSVRLDENHEHGQNSGQGTGAGSWTVSWRVLGADRHASTGNVSFTVRGATRCEELPQPATQLVPADQGDGTDGASAGAAGSRPGGDVRRATSAGVSSNDRFPVLPVTAVAVVTVALVGGRLLQRRTAAGRS